MELLNKDFYFNSSNLLKTKLLTDLKSGKSDKTNDLSSFSHKLFGIKSGYFYPFLLYICLKNLLGKILF